LKKTNVLRKIIAYAGLTSAFCAVLFLLVDLVVLPYSQAKFDKAAIMPELVGKDSSLVTLLLQEVGLKVGVIKHEYSDSYAAGIILEQFPKPGHEIKLTRSVGLTISLGKEYKTVPLLLGMQPLEAADALLKIGLRLGDVSESFNPEGEQGTIIATKPLSGSQISRGSAIDVVIASRNVGDVAYVPSLVNLTVEESKKLLIQAGLRMGTITLKPDDEMLPGTVLQQKIRAGALLPRGSVVDLTVSE
jgi:serine/threonine-protein kinase